MAFSIIQREVIEDDAVNAAKVEDGTIVAADIAAGSITNADVKSDAAIATSKITGLATSATTDTTNASNIASGTLPTARLDTGTTANKIVILDGNAKLPAISGASLTGIESATKSASDPVVTTNPSGGLGTKWINTTSGEVYICTDATAGANVWTNVGAGTGDIEPIPNPWQGTVSGYRAGGRPGSGTTNTIDKWSFTSDANATDVGDMTYSDSSLAAQASLTYGYTSSGNSGVTTINKWSFASDGNAVAYSGTLTFGRWALAGTYSLTHGYASGGNNSAPYNNVIDKFNYASEGNATDVGNLTEGRAYSAACSSETHGYHMGGSSNSPPPTWNIIDRWSFTTD